MSVLRVKYVEINIIFMQNIIGNISKAVWIKKKHWAPLETLPLCHIFWIINSRGVKFEVLSISETVMRLPSNTVPLKYTSVHFAETWVVNLMNLKRGLINIINKAYHFPLLNTYPCVTNASWTGTMMHSEISPNFEKCAHNSSFQLKVQNNYITENTGILTNRILN